MQLNVIEKAALVFACVILGANASDIDIESGDVMSVRNRDIERSPLPAVCIFLCEGRGTLSPNACVWIVAIEIV